MKTLIAFPVMLMLGASGWAQQSPADVARQTRSQRKSPAIVRFDDDSLRRTATDDTSADDTKDDSKKEAGENGKKPEDAKDAKKEKPKTTDFTAKIEDT